jgi:hypothetical protein
VTIFPFDRQFPVPLIFWGWGTWKKRTLLESLDLAGGEGDADAVDLGTFPELALLWLVVRHFGRKD